MDLVGLIGVMQISFKQAFCDHYGCKPEEFESLVFGKCMHRRARPFVWLIRMFRPDSFGADFHVIRQVGETTNLMEAMVEIDSYAQGRKGRVGDFFRVRISGKRLLRVAQKFLPQHPEYRHKVQPNVT
jgi:hypothetical protein